MAWIFFFIDHLWLCAPLLSHSQPLSKQLRRNIEFNFHAIIIEKNTLFTLCFCIIQHPVALVWYYHCPFFSNVETQVKGEESVSIAGFVRVLDLFLFGTIGFFALVCN